MPNISVAMAARLNNKLVKNPVGLNRQQQLERGKRVSALAKWVQTPVSSWVWGLRYQVIMTAHDIQYKDKKRRLTALCRYPGTHINTYYAMRRAMSKGKFVHRTKLYYKPYILVKLYRGKPPKRKASMRIRGAALKRFNTIFRKP